MTLAAALAFTPAATFAEPLSPYASVEAFTDHRDRGLSQSDGDAGIRVQGGIDLAGFDARVTATTLSDSPRHGGADLGIDLGVSYRIERGLFFFDAGAVGRLYQGAADDLDYVELVGSGGMMLGPAELALSASYAPSQEAIGGDNLYLRARASIAMVGTPFTISGHIGRSSGSVDDPARAARLRPGGSYTDWALGVDYTTGPLGFGVRYSDTDHARDHAASPYADARHSGAALTGRVSLSF